MRRECNVLQILRILFSFIMLSGEVKQSILKVVSFIKKEMNLAYDEMPFHAPVWRKHP